jgi:hypothetical protein
VAFFIQLAQSGAIRRASALLVSATRPEGSAAAESKPVRGSQKKDENQLTKRFVYSSYRCILNKKLIPRRIASPGTWVADRG